MSPAVAKPVGLDPELINALKAQLQGDKKPTIPTGADEFGTGKDGSKPFIKASMSLDSESGDILIRVPYGILYTDTRDTTSRNRRVAVARLDDPNGVETVIIHPSGADIPVKITLSSTLNLSVSALKV